MINYKCLMNYSFFLYKKNHFVLGPNFFFLTCTFYLSVMYGETFEVYHNHHLVHTTLRTCLIDILSLQLLLLLLYFLKKVK